MDNDLRAKAYAIRVARLRRGDLLPSAIFGEPAWDALLELYIAEGDQPFSLTRLADCTRVPLTTLLRWLEYLTDQGLVRVARSVSDARSRVVDLTPKGRAIMASVLQAMPKIAD